MNRIIKNRVRKIFSFAESLGTKPDAIIIKNGLLACNMPANISIKVCYTSMK